MINLYTRRPSKRWCSRTDACCSSVSPWYHHLPECKRCVQNSTFVSRTRQRKYLRVTPLGVALLLQTASKLLVPKVISKHYTHREVCFCSGSLRRFLLSRQRTPEETVSWLPLWSTANNSFVLRMLHAYTRGVNHRTSEAAWEIIMLETNFLFIQVKQVYMKLKNYVFVAETSVCFGSSTDWSSLQVALVLFGDFSSPWNRWTTPVLVAPTQITEDFDCGPKVLPNIKTSVW